MDTRVRKALLNAAIFLYAVLGFSVSVLTSLFGLLGPRQPPKPTNVPLSKPHLQPLVPRTRPIPRNNLRSCSDKPSTAALVETPTEPTLDDKQRRRKMLAGHRRSRSIPLITLDYFGSTEDLHKIPHHDSDMEPRSHFSPLPVRKPLTFVIPPPPGREWVEPPWTAGYDSEKSGFKLANLFSKEKKREKEKMRKVGESKPPPSPTLPEPREDSAKQARACRKRRQSDMSKHPLVSTEGQGNASRPPVRRVSSAPMEDRLTMRFDLTFSRTVEKKKSGTLRTHPYEAPFFCPPPGQPIRLKSQSTSDLRSKALHKPSRTLTIKT